MSYEHLGVTSVQTVVSTQSGSEVEKIVTGKDAVKRGERSDRVREIQEGLNQLGAKLVVDGIFGARTEAAIKDYQKARKLSVNGTLDGPTLLSMKSDLQAGAKVSFPTRVVSTRPVSPPVEQTVALTPPPPPPPPSTPSTPSTLSTVDSPLSKIPLVPIAIAAALGLGLFLFMRKKG